MILFNLFAQAVNLTTIPHTPADQTSIDNVLSIVFQITGSIALLMVVIGGFRYIVAHGDPSAVTQAKNTILYAIIGLLISIFAYTIVNFVIRRLV
jgi:hypothetical protein